MNERQWFTCHSDKLGRDCGDKHDRDIPEVRK